MWTRLASLAIAAVSASAALGQEREWRLESSEDEIYLIFGVPESDDVGVSFWCRPGDGFVKLFLPRIGEGLLIGRAVGIDINLGDDHFTFTAETSPHAGTGEVDAEAMLSTKDRLFPVLMRKDRMALIVIGDERIFPLDGAEFAKLLRLCSARQPGEQPVQSPDG